MTAQAEAQCFMLYNLWSTITIVQCFNLITLSPTSHGVQAYLRTTYNCIKYSKFQFKLGARVIDAIPNN